MLVQFTAGSPIGTLTADSVLPTPYYDTVAGTPSIAAVLPTPATARRGGRGGRGRPVAQPAAAITITTQGAGHDTHLAGGALRMSLTGRRYVM
jgi:hypothetical protein